MKDFWLHVNSINAIMPEVREILRNVKDNPAKRVIELLFRCVQHLDAENRILAHKIKEMEEEQDRKDLAKNLISDE